VYNRGKKFWSLRSLQEGQALKVELLDSGQYRENASQGKIRTVIQGIFCLVFISQISLFHARNVFFLLSVGEGPIKV
jgi:hypothetical protein